VPGCAHLHVVRVPFGDAHKTGVNHLQALETLQKLLAAAQAIGDSTAANSPDNVTLTTYRSEQASGRE
jgi:hypothetical protein